MNVWKGIIDTARATQPAAEHSARIMRCVAVGERHTEMSTALSAVLGERGTWPGVSDSLCAIIASAMTALATMETNPEKYFGEYLRPHINGEPWEWFEVPAPVPTNRPARAHHPTGHMAGCSAVVFPGSGISCSCSPEDPLAATRDRTCTCGYGPKVSPGIVQVRDEQICAPWCGTAPGMVNLVGMVQEMLAVPPQPGSTTPVGTLQDRGPIQLAPGRGTTV